LDVEGRITRINHHACALLGWTEHELLGRDWIERCLPPLVQPMLRRKFSALVGGDLSIVQNPVLTRSGEERMIEWLNILVRDEAGCVVATYSSGADITERTRALEALHAAEQRAQRARESAEATVTAVQEIIDDLANGVQLLHLVARSPLPAETQRTVERTIQQAARQLKSLEGVEGGAFARRKSDVPKGRVAVDGTLRRTGDQWSPPSPLVLCEGCGTRTAHLVAFFVKDDTVTYRCHTCGHRFDRIADP
jgi:PAS domain S-box-containing protein